MSNRQRIGGRSSFGLYAGLIAILALAAGLVFVLLVVVPDRQHQQQAELHRIQATVTGEAQHALATATFEARTTEVQRAYAAGVAFASADDWSKAADEFAKAVSLDPGYRDAATRLTEARNQGEAAKIAAVIQSAATATAQALSEIESAYQRGLGYANLKRWEQAKVEFEKVLGVAPNYKEVQVKLAEVETKLAQVQLPTSTATIFPSATPSSITAMPVSTPTPNIVTRTFTVYANKSWTDTGMGVGAGDKMRIEYQGGLWTYWPGTVAPFDANGNPQRYICADLIKASDCIEPLPQANKGSLIARIGSGGVMYVGNRSAFDAINAGSLELSMNDSKLPIDYSKNEGSIVVRITITKP